MPLLDSWASCYTRAVLTVLADCIVPVQCINPKTSYSTAAPPTLDYWVAALVIVIGFALAGMLILIRGRM